MSSDEQLGRLKAQSQEKPLSRRDFMRALTLAGAAGPGLVTAALSGFSLTQSQRAEAAELIVQNIGKLPKRKYGSRTGMMVTPICISMDWNRELFAPAVAVGINFIHKAGYWRSADAIPDAIRQLPRESYYTDTTVDNTSPGHDPDNWQEAYDSVVDELNRTGLKYFDVYRAHYGWHSVNKFKNNNISYKAFEKLKKEGKVRHFAVSQHQYPGEVMYPEIIQAQIDSGIIDSMQVWFSYGYPKEIEEVFAKASMAGISMTAMKVNEHGRDKMARDPARMAQLKAPGQVGRALIRQVMTTKRPDGRPIFNTCVSALGNLQMFEENVGALSPRVVRLDGFDDFAAVAV
jgi:diketogulonate reductase-like aldo/keto reductase